MKEIAVLLKECSERFSETEEYRILKTYRTRDNRLSFDERLSIAKSVERTYEPVFDLIKADAPSLTDSDLLFYALSVQGVERVAIAECLTVTKDAVRMRKLRLREKLPSKWFYLAFPELKRNSSESVTSHIAADAEPGIILPSEPTKNQNGMKDRLSFGKAVASCFEKYFTFKGRASRSEYWYFVLFCVIVRLCFEVFKSLVTNTAYPAITDNAQGICRTCFIALRYIMYVALVFPMFSVTVRRLHDRDDYGWLAILIYLVPWLFNRVLEILILSFSSALKEQAESPEVINGLTALALSYIIINQVALIAQLVLFCRVGTEGPNSFGHDPVCVLHDASKDEPNDESQQESVMNEQV